MASLARSSSSDLLMRVSTLGSSSRAAQTIASSSARRISSAAAPLLRTRPVKPLPAPASLASFHTSRSLARSDDPGGKPNDGSHPTVYDDFYNLLESTDPDQIPALSIESITPERITLSDGLVVTSGLILVNGSCFMWDAPPLNADRALPSGVGWEEWLQGEGRVEEVWKLFEVLEPKPEILLFGTGSRVLPLPSKIRTHMAELGIQVDCQSSQNAASTFNVLAEEGRKVACALIPSNRGPLERQMGSEDAPLADPDTTSRRTEAIPTAASPAGSMPGGTRSFSTSGRSSARAPSGEFTPTLQHFLMHSSVLSLYRRLLRATRPIPNPSARWETIQWYRSEMERERNERDLQKIRDLMAQGGRQIKILEGSVGLTDVDGVGLGKGKGLRGTRSEAVSQSSQRERATL